MNKLAIALTLFASVYAQDEVASEEEAKTPSSECMYCRRMDQNSGFLVSYSYCEVNDECLQDAWNYINRDCNSDWQSGSSMELEACYPLDQTCPEKFISSEDLYGSYRNNTWTLAEGSKCDVEIDASLGVARVIFDETSYLGLENTDKKLGEVITFEGGTDNKITIYNAAQSGALTFLISFSGAVQMGAAALATAFVVGQAF